MTHKYFVDLKDWTISRIEAPLDAGTFLTLKLDWRGQGLESGEISLRELKAMKQFVSLREARTYCEEQGVRA